MLPLDEIEDSKITANLVNEFSDQSIKILKESEINKKEHSKTKNNLVVFF